MSQSTPRLDLPYIMPAQAQKHVTHNEALQRLDNLIQLSVIAQRSDPPAERDAGDAYIIAAGGSGDWAGHDQDIAFWQEGRWQYLQPFKGWLCWDQSQDSYVFFQDSAWQILTAPAAETMLSTQNLTLLGVNTTADTANKLSVKSENSLFDNIGGAHRLKINKSGSGETASILFQDDYRSYAEIGLLGNGDLSVQISADGANWTQALTISAATGVMMVDQPIIVKNINENDGVMRLRGNIPANADLNEYLQTGMWHQPFNINAARGHNYPVDLAGLFSCTVSGAMVYQTYRVYNGGPQANRIYTRGRYVNQWSKWHEIQHDAI